MPYSWLNWATMTMYRYNSSRRSHSLFWLNIWYKRTAVFMRLDTDGEWPFLFQIWTICFSCLSKYKISGFSAYVFRVQVHILEFHFLQWQHLGSIIKFALLFRIAGHLLLLCDPWFQSLNADDSRIEWSTKVASEATDIGRSTFYPDSSLSNTFGFKIQDKQGLGFIGRFQLNTS